MLPLYYGIILPQKMKRRKTMNKKNTNIRNYGMTNVDAVAYTYDYNDVFFDVEVESAGVCSNEIDKDWVPTYKDAFEFIINEIRTHIGEYMTPFNVLMIKVLSILLIVALLIGGAITGAVKAHMAHEKEREAARQAAIEAEERAAREEKRQAVIADNKAVVGKWYEMDTSRDDIRTLLIEVDDDANCVYTIGDEIGSFTFSGAKLSLAGSEGGKDRSLILEDEQLKDEVNGVTYYKTNANIKSLKFAEFLKNSLPGTYQEFLGEYLYIYPDGKWQTSGPWVDDHYGTWYMEINEGSVSFIFEGMGVHYGGGNIYKVNEDEYESEKAEISSGDFSLGLDVNTYDRITSKLP